MIISLSIRDFALVDKLELAFEPGFSVFTGETGAGKSILLKALGLLLGDRADRELVRSNSEQARVEGAFVLRGPSGEAARELLEEAGVPWEETLLVARTVNAQGGSRAFINGCGVGVAVLAKLGAMLVEVSSQHQHQALLDDINHLGLLDRALGEAGSGALYDYRQAYGAWCEAKEELDRLGKLAAVGAERADYLKFQVAEVRAVAPRPGEDEELGAERSRLANAEKIASAYAQAHEEVFGDDLSAISRVGRAIRNVERAAAFDARAAGVLELLTEAELNLRDAGATLGDWAQAGEADPSRLDEIERRAELLDRLKRKHGRSLEEVVEKLASMESELLLLENRETAQEEAVDAQREAAARLKILGEALSAQRVGAAPKLGAAVGLELAQLGFGEGVFSVSVKPANPGPDGADEVRFMFAPNPGEEPRPLSSIASGGELSRVLLAVKNALRDGFVETLVFDEVDAGIGGRVSERVGGRLADLARSAQVLCVTHLPQIASRAAVNLKVDKAIENGRTVTTVVRLSEGERIRELARMLGGGESPDAAWEHAESMIRRSGI